MPHVRRSVPICSTLDPTFARARRHRSELARRRSSPDRRQRDGARSMVARDGDGTGDPGHARGAGDADPSRSSSGSWARSCAGPRSARSGTPADTVVATVEGRRRPAPAAPLVRVRPAGRRSRPKQAALVASVAALAALANFGGCPVRPEPPTRVTDAFGQSDEATSAVALAVARARGARLARGHGPRRPAGPPPHAPRLLSSACAPPTCVSAVAPTFEVFTGAQLLSRALVNAVLVVAAHRRGRGGTRGRPRRSRSSCSALAARRRLRRGRRAAPPRRPRRRVVAHLVRDQRADGVCCSPASPGTSRETTRYTASPSRTHARGRLREVFDRVYGWRFFLLGLAALPHQLLQRAVGAAHEPVPHRRARLLEHRRRRVPRASPTGSRVCSGSSSPGRLTETPRPAPGRHHRPARRAPCCRWSSSSATALAAVGHVDVRDRRRRLRRHRARHARRRAVPDRGPRHVERAAARVAVAGSAAGLLLATNLEDAVGGLGNAIALCGIAPLLAATLVVPWLPEPAARTLDDVSPSEV